MSGGFNIADLRLADTPIPASEAAKPPRRKRQFVMVPMAWKARLGAARSASTIKVALELLFRHWKSSGKPVLLANTAMARIGVSRDAKWRALRELEALGLVRVERRPRKSPIIAVLDLPENAAA